MSDSEEYSSGEDEDYLPSGEDYSEDDVSELVKEDEAAEEEEEEEAAANPAKCKNAKGLTCRNRSKRGSLFLGKDGRKPPKDEDSEDSDSGESHNTPLKENERREKEEALWASFLSDVGQKPKAAATGEASCTQEGKPAEEENSCEPQEARTEPRQSKVAITQVFDFAGEEVRVVKEADAASREARLFLKQQQQQEPAGPASRPAAPGVKRPSGMNHLLGKITAKKQKLSTLEKSKLDWESFKEEEGISDELAIHNRGKDGYLERQAFLERVDHRQFERERDIRLSTMKP